MKLFKHWRNRKNITIEAPCHSIYFPNEDTYQRVIFSPEGIVLHRYWAPDIGRWPTKNEWIEYDENKNIYYGEIDYWFKLPPQEKEIQ